MAYNTFFHSVPLIFLDGNYTFAQIMEQATLVGSCSHYLAMHIELRRLLVEGHSISDASHALVDPHYRLPHELPGIQEELAAMLLTDFDGDDWSSNEIQGFINACVECIKTNTAMAVTLGL